MDCRKFFSKAPWASHLYILGSLKGLFIQVFFFLKNFLGSRSKFLWFFVDLPQTSHRGMFKEFFPLRPDQHHPTGCPELEPDCITVWETWPTSCTRLPRTRARLLCSSETWSTFSLWCPEPGTALKYLADPVLDLNNPAKPVLDLNNPADLALRPGQRPPHGCSQPEPDCHPPLRPDQCPPSGCLDPEPDFNAPLRRGRHLPPVCKEIF